jgi:erythrocyte band 7 integral membrane protein
LSKDLQESLSSAAKERRLAESKIISAKADVESAKLMRQAAEELNTKAAMQIRYLETLKTVSKSNTKVIFIPELKSKERVQHLITQGLMS